MPRHDESLVGRMSLGLIYHAKDNSGAHCDDLIRSHSVYAHYFEHSFELKSSDMPD
jgi:hypothetical protein